MPWISYAQNGEDVRLRRAFAGQQSGFYIDVGANHPVLFSITKHFYESGWSGLNIEPLPKQFALLESGRPRDINLNVGCSNQNGARKLYSARGHASAISTFTAEEAAIHERKGFEFDAITSHVLKLSSICEAYVGQRTIDFLSVDVEGHEREVLEGADFLRFRPRVVLVEATRPNTTEPSHECWEHLLLNSGYSFAVFDGLNRFYVRREDEQLIPALALAPNVFDDFVPHIYRLSTRFSFSRLVGAASTPIALVSRTATRFRSWISSHGAGRHG